MAISPKASLAMRGLRSPFAKQRCSSSLDDLTPSSFLRALSMCTMRPVPDDMNGITAVVPFLP